MSWILTITPPDGSDTEVIQQRLWALGTTGIAETSTDGVIALIAGFDDCPTAEHAGSVLRRESVAIYSIARVDPNAWGAPEPQCVTVGDRTLTIEVGQAFGHGQHPTTALALGTLPRLVTPGVSVLDVGTGTGILALAASALGARPVVGVDTDPEAIRVAGANAVANQLDVIVTDQPLDALVGLADLGELGFDVVVVNMLAADLRPIAGHVERCLHADGLAFVTGFLAHQQAWVESMFPDLELVDSIGASNDHQRGAGAEWGGMTLRRTPDAR